MNLTFNDIVENIRNLPLDQKFEIQSLLEKSIIEEERNKIYKNFVKSRAEYKSGKLKFSNDIVKLKKFMDE